MPEVPAGYRLDHVDAAWMLEEERTGRWENGIGQFASDARNVRNQYALILRSAEGDPVAIAGVFETYGMLEIGVDVLQTHQGRGLAPVVVSAAARQILADGRIPLYGCAADNIRSQRTALASGFLPVYADAAVGVAALQP
jgi:RimJ/RimL family protein N-acetyltransferase